MPKLLSAFNNILFFATLALLVIIPLYPKLPVVSVKGTFVAIRMEDFLIALIYLLWLIYLILSKTLGRLLHDQLFRLILLFLFAGAVSLFSAVFVTKTVVSTLGLLHFFRRIEFIMLMPLVYTVVRTKKQLQVCLATLSVVVLLVDLYALGQEYLNWPVISTTNSEFSKGLILRLTEEARVNSTFAGHYDLAVFLVMVLVITPALFFAIKNLKLKIWIFILSILSFVVLVMTAARLSFIAVLVGIPTTLVLIKKRIFVLLIIILAMVTLVYPSQLRDRFIFTVTVNLLHEGQRYTGATQSQKAIGDFNLPTIAVDTSEGSQGGSASASRSAEVASDIAPGEPIDTTQLGVYRSFAIRLNVEWPRAVRAFFKNPLLGTGYSSIGLATDNDLLRSLGEVGLLGTLAFGLIFVKIIKLVLRNYKSPDKFIRFFSAGTLSIIIAFLLNALFIDVFEASKIASLFWLVVGLNLSISHYEKNN